MRKLMLAFLVLLIAALAPMAGRALAGDTGTYRILSYAVMLTPHSDGAVAVEYYQKWRVTGGHIPWITVGTPNGNFAVVSYRGAVSEAQSASQSGWSGVRLDLDRDYQPGETFEVAFSIVQRGLFYAEKGSYKLDFTPGWYDLAAIDTLQVGVKFFASIDSVTADPAPSVVSGDEMLWNTYGLGPGGRFTIHAAFPVGLFPAGIAKGNLKSTSGGGGSVAIFFIIFIVFIIIMSLRFKGRRYSGGRMFYGGILGGGLGGGKPGGGGRSAGGGGGFGGAAMSCACACVSCACACACAGGGGAGCARKIEHTCPACEKRRA